MTFIFLSRQTAFIFARHSSGIGVMMVVAGRAWNPPPTNAKTVWHYMEKSTIHYYLLYLTRSEMAYKNKKIMNQIFVFFFPPVPQ